MKTIRRLSLRFQIFSLELQIDGAGEVMACVSDPYLLAKIDIARSVARRELARLRSEYNATLPPGKRITWRMA